MFKNLGLHFEVLTPLSVVLLVLGGILGYGGSFMVRRIYAKPSIRVELAVKIAGIALVIAGMVLIFKR